MSQQMERRWVDWWTQGFWQQADSSWHHIPFFNLDYSLREHLSRSHNTAIETQLGLAHILPGSPDDRILSLSQLSPEQRQLMTRLVSEICQRDQQTDELNTELRRWCLRITQALRPGLWLPDELAFSHAPQPAALALLAYLLPTASWLRLRMSFDYQAVRQLPELTGDLPRNKLYALWDAVIWRSQQQEEHQHVDH